MAREKYSPKHAKPAKGDKPGKHAKPEGKGRPDARAGVKIQPEPPAPSCGYCTNGLNSSDGRWSQLVNRDCPVHAKGKLSGEK